MHTTLDEESPRARLALLLKHFSELNDDREAWRVLYPIKEALRTGGSIGDVCNAMRDVFGEYRGGAFF